jgi:hypothetical protein
MRRAMPGWRFGVARGRFPLWLKVAWTAWLLVWAPFYWQHYGPQNFLWFCDMSNIVVGVGLWLESPLLFSTQVLSIGIVQTLYAIDFCWRLALGHHLTGGTEYMFDPAFPLHIRALSLFHLAIPPLLAWAVAQLGYDRRALPIQMVVAWVILPVSLLFGSVKDVNWVYGPYERVQTWMSQGQWFAICMVGFPLLLYLPTHLALARWAPRAGRLPRLGSEVPA